MSNFITTFCTVYTCAFLFLSQYMNEHNHRILYNKMNIIDNKVSRICSKYNIKNEDLNEKEEFEKLQKQMKNL